MSNAPGYPTPYAAAPNPQGNPYVYQAPPPPQRKVPGRLTGILAICFFWTASIGCALSFVSIQQSRRAGTSATLGIIGFILGLAVFIGIFFYVLFGVLDVWKIL